MGMYDKLLQEDKKPLKQAASVLPNQPPSAAPALPSSDSAPANIETKEPRNQGTKERRNIETYERRNIETKEPRKTTTQPQKKPAKQYNTFLTIESIQSAKRLALDENKKDYEVLQEALDQYLKKRGYLET